MTRRVLVVDDDETFRAVIRETLVPHGYEVEEAANGREARAALAARMPDAVLLDVMMPDLDGVAFCREIREDERGRRLPVLVISALGEEMAREAMTFGATEYITKPVELAALRSKLDALLSKKPR